MNNKIEAIVFDLDGTLISSHQSIYYCTLRTFKELGIPVNIPEDKFYYLIGHHFKDIFDAFNIEVEDLEGFIDLYKSFYFDYIDYSKVYPGVYEIIDYLNEKNIKLGLLTTKGNDQAIKIMKHFNLFDKFDLVTGRRPGIGIKPAAEPLELIINEFKINPINCLMVGDSELDIQCGKNAGASTAAVTFGYRTKEELQKQNPDYILDNILDLKYIFNGV